MSTTTRLIAQTARAMGVGGLSPHGKPAGALYDGAVKTKFVPFDPTAPHTRSSIPPTFILALLVAVLGIPLYLLLNGGFKSSGDRLEDRMKAPDTEGSAAFANDEDGDDDDKKKRKREEEDLDEPGTILEFDDLKSLGGLVGFAAVVVLAFAIFPEELNGMLASVTGGMDVNTVTSWVGGQGQAVPNGVRQEEVRTEKIITHPDGTTAGYSEKVVREGPPQPELASGAGTGVGGNKMTDMLGGRSMVDLRKSGSRPKHLPYLPEDIRFTFQSSCARWTLNSAPTWASPSVRRDQTQWSSPRRPNSSTRLR
jgi:hypothetical protein